MTLKILSKFSHDALSDNDTSTYTVWNGIRVQHALTDDLNSYQLLDLKDTIPTYNTVAHDNATPHHDQVWW